MPAQQLELAIRARQEPGQLTAACPDLLPVPYFHVVFTLPHELKPLALAAPPYVAQTSINALAVLESAPGEDGPEGGSNSLRWWRRRESNPSSIFVSI